MLRTQLHLISLVVAVVLALVLLGSLHHQGHITLPMVKEWMQWEEIKAPTKGELAAVEGLLDIDDQVTVVEESDLEIPPFDNSSVRIYIGVVCPPVGLF